MIYYNIFICLIPISIIVVFRSVIITKYKNKYRNIQKYIDILKILYFIFSVLSLLFIYLHLYNFNLVRDIFFLIIFILFWLYYFKNYYCYRKSIKSIRHYDAELAVLFSKHTYNNNNKYYGDTLINIYRHLYLDIFYYIDNPYSKTVIHNFVDDHNIVYLDEYTLPPTIQYIKQYNYKNDYRMFVLLTTMAILLTTKERYNYSVYYHCHKMLYLYSEDYKYYDMPTHIENIHNWHMKYTDKYFYSLDYYIYEYMFRCKLFYTPIEFYYICKECTLKFKGEYITTESTGIDNLLNNINIKLKNIIKTEYKKIFNNYYNDLHDKRISKYHEATDALNIMKRYNTELGIMINNRAYSNNRDNQIYELYNDTDLLLNSVGNIYDMPYLRAKRKEILAKLKIELEELK